jgi:hypothetical protein
MNCISQVLITYDPFIVKDLKEALVESPLISKDAPKTAVVVLKLAEPLLNLVDGQLLYIIVQIRQSL